MSVCTGRLSFVGGNLLNWSTKTWKTEQVNVIVQYDCRFLSYKRRGDLQHMLQNKEGGDL